MHAKLFLSVDINIATGQSPTSETRHRCWGHAMATKEDKRAYKEAKVGRASTWSQRHVSTRSCMNSSAAEDETDGGAVGLVDEEERPREPKGDDALSLFSSFCGKLTLCTPSCASSRGSKSARSSPKARTSSFSKSRPSMPSSLPPPSPPLYKKAAP